MANLATTKVKMTGSHESMLDLWGTLQKMGVNSKNVWLDDLAARYGIDYKAKHINVRGNIYWAEFEEDEEDETCLLSLETETAWDRSEIFEEINHVLGDSLSVSFMVCECGCEVYYIHDEGSYFPYECCVSSSGEPFEEECDYPYESIKDAIKMWSSLTGIEQGERTDEEMVGFINEYDYDEDDVYFYIRPFTFE